MHLGQFISLHNIKLDKNVRELCLEGIECAKRSLDPNHGLEHVEDLLEELSTYLMDRKISKSIDFNVLLPAIVFHDIWYSTRNQTRNLLVFVFRLFFESIGSALLLRKYLIKHKIESSLARRIKLAVYRHVRTGFRLIDRVLFSARSIEEKLLCDLDELNQWSMSRLKRLEDTYVKNKVKRTDFILLMIYFYFFITSTKDTVYYGDYFRNKFKTIKPQALKYFRDLYREIYEHPHKYFERTWGYSYFLFLRPETFEKLMK